MVDDVDSHKSHLTPKPFRNEDRNEECANKIKNIKMFASYMTIMLGGISIGPMMTSIFF
jgi:hypothetical protein